MIDHPERMMPGSWDESHDMLDEDELGLESRFLPMSVSS